jgi:hypothetical protein
MDTRNLIQITTLTFATFGAAAHAQDWNLPRHALAAGVDEANPPASCRTEAGYAGRSAYNAQTWPGGIVRYDFEAALTATERSAIQGAMDELAAHCGVRFVPWDLVNPSHLTFGRNSDPTYSFSSAIGWTGSQQFVRIGNNFWGRRFNICHEIMHAMGFIHEHSRADRDSFVTLNLGAVRPGFEGNFNYFPLLPINGQYDFDSVMHYSQTELSSVGDRTVLVRPQWRRWWQYTIGVRDHLSVGDLWGLTTLYGGTPPPSTFSLASPALGAAVGAGWIPTFAWQSATGAVSYHLVVSTDPRFVAPVIDVTVAGNAYAHPGALPDNRLYFWAVTAANAVGTTGMFPIPRGTFMTSGTYPAVLYVDASAPAGGDGLSWAGAFNDLQSALFVTDGASDAGINVEVRVAGGTYKPDLGTGDRSGIFLVRNRTTLRGGYAGRAGTDPDLRDGSMFPSVLSADLAGDDAPGFANRADNSFGLVVSLDGDGSSTVDGFTIRGGNGGALPGFGSGIYVDGDGLTVSNCSIEDCSGTIAGTCIFVYAGAPLISDCTIARNRADVAASIPGGAGITTRFSSATIRRCSVLNNTAFFGAGIMLRGAAPVVDNCLIARNTATSAASFGGGGVYIRQAASAVITNCTIADNASVPVGSAGGVGVDATSSAALRNCVLWGNAPAQIAGPTAVASCIVQGGAAGTRVYAQDPLFLDAAAGNYAPAPRSPAIDSGDNALVTGTVDLSGQARFHDDLGVRDRGVPGGAGGLAVVDLGAYEFQSRSCGGPDFDGDGDIGTDADLEAFFACLVGSCCPTCPADADFDADGDLGTDADIGAFFRVLAGGPC